MKHEVFPMPDHFEFCYPNATGTKFKKGKNIHVPLVVGLIMIKFLRTNRASIYLTFDKNGLDLMLNTLKGQEQDKSFQIEFDRSVLNHKKAKIESRKMIFVLDDEIDCSELCDFEGTIIWRFNSEDLDEMEYRFNECKKDGFFSPAEFISVHIPKDYGYDQIYCQLVD